MDTELQFVRFESKGGNPKGFAVFYDPYSLTEDGHVALDQRSLELRITDLANQAPDYDSSHEMGVLAEMKKGGAGC